MQECFKNFAVTYLIDVIKNDHEMLNINLDKFTFEKDIVSDPVIVHVFELQSDKNVLMRELVGQRGRARLSMKRGRRRNERLSLWSMTIWSRRGGK
jgi:hypothetical protein